MSLTTKSLFTPLAGSQCPGLAPERQHCPSPDPLGQAPHPQSKFPVVVLRGPESPRGLGLTARMVPKFQDRLHRDFLSSRGSNKVP